jgi:hypothetical protein
MAVFSSWMHNFLPERVLQALSETSALKVAKGNRLGNRRLSQCSDYVFGYSRPAGCFQRCSGGVVAGGRR